MTFDMSLFDNAAFGIFKAKKPDLPVPHSEVWQEVLDEFKVNDLNQDGAVGELNRFSEWIVSWTLHVHTAMVDRIRIGLSIPMQGGFMNIDLEAGFPITFGEEGGIETEASPKMVNDTAVKLAKQVFQTLTHLQKFVVGGNSVPANTGNATSNPPNQPPQQQQQTQTGAVERVIVETLSVNSNDGKLTYRLKGAWFTQYGAPVYPEVFAAANINISQYGIGSYSFPRTVDIQRIGDKKIKVIKIY